MKLSFCAGLYNLLHKSRAAASDRWWNSLSDSIYCKSDPEVWLWKHEGTSNSTWGQPLVAPSRENIYAHIIRESCGFGLIRSFRILQQHTTLDKVYLYSPYITIPGLEIISKSFGGLELSILIWINLSLPLHCLQIIALNMKPQTTQ